MLTTKEITDIVNNATDLVEFPKSPELLYAPLKYILDLGGKRIRPRLCLTTYSLFKENIDSTIINPSLALEIFHNFTLIHDDIMDKAELRRSKPTVYKKWNENVAILSGDAMCIASYQFLSKAPEEMIAKITPLFTETALKVCEGQQLDMDFEERQDVTMDEYITMIGLKTAVLLACAAKMGAILAGAPDNLCDKLYSFGYQLGISFQIQDDLFDSFGDEKIFGKKIGGDILNNKKTWLLIKCLNNIDNSQKERLFELLNMPATEEKIEAVQKFFAQNSIDALAKEEINSYYYKAMETLKQTTLNSQQISHLEEYATELIKRTK